MPLFQTPPSSICILRLSAIGDCCHALALVRVIQRAWPETRITWITGKIEATLFADLPGVEVIPFDKSKGWRGYRELWQYRGHGDLQGKSVSVKLCGGKVESADKNFGSSGR